VLGFLLPFHIQDVLHLSPSFMGLIFLAVPVFTITLATAAGQLTDRIGPRIPATISIVFTMGAFVTGILLKTDSHWICPTALMGFFGLGSGFFNTPNQTAIIGSVPIPHLESLDRGGCPRSRGAILSAIPAPLPGIFLRQT
jgi:MFS family permease